MPTNASVSCIIPVYNEASTVQDVVLTVLQSTDIDEVIVVNDGSTDSTARVLAELHHKKLFIVSLENNRGKAQAVQEGLKHAHGDILCLLDADLLGLTTQDINNLLAPVMHAPNSVTFAFLGNAPRIARVLGINIVSGQRAFPRKFADMLFRKNIHGYLLEIALNDIFLREHATISTVRWDGVRHRKKIEKRGIWNGWWNDLYMITSIMFALGPRGIMRQFGTIPRRHPNA